MIVARNTKLKQSEYQLWYLYCNSKSRPGGMKIRIFISLSNQAAVISNAFPRFLRSPEAES